MPIPVIGQILTGKPEHSNIFLIMEVEGIGNVEDRSTSF